MNTSGSGGIPSGRCEASQTAEPQNEQRDEIAAMVFASLIAPPPAPPPPAPTAPPPQTGTSQSIASSQWRTGASAMTGLQPGPESNASGMVTHVQSESLGRVSVSVDQIGGCVRVVVTADRPEVLCAMQARQSVLLQQLQSAGIAVSSLAMVRPTSSGITLAPKVSMETVSQPGRRLEGESDEDKEGLERARLGRPRTVNLTG